MAQPAKDLLSETAKTLATSIDEREHALSLIVLRNAEMHDRNEDPRYAIRLNLLHFVEIAAAKPSDLIALQDGKRERTVPKYRFVGGDKRADGVTADAPFVAHDWSLHGS